MKIACNKVNPPLGGLLAVSFYRASAENIDIVWGNDSSVTLPDSKKPVPYGTSNDLIRILENNFNKSADPLQKVTMNHWLSFSLILDDEIPKSIEYLDKTLSALTYLVGESLSVSDLAVFSALHVSKKFKEETKNNPSKNIQRWMKLIEAQASVSKVLKELPNDVLENLNKSTSRRSPVNNNESSPVQQQQGKFVELPHAEMGKVIVRFPPEASGYLHIGHAKAALLNQYYQQAFQGKLIMRFDDTNPAKENAEFEKVILKDVEMLEIKPDMFTHTSQYFDLMIEYCEKLIKEGKAFVDDTPAEQMKNEREQKIDSKNRNNSVEVNLKLWEEMKQGTDQGITCCVRAKIDMQSANGCMRDPTIYRCKPETHPRTGNQYKVYPTYDFACPIVDSVEGVTHVLRTMEYHDRDPQFYWFIDALGLRKPYIWEYSRLSMTNTVLSKRKLTWFVEQRLVDGWDDPRMPTVRGVLRRGLTVEALRQFIHAQGSSRSVVFMEWDKIWAINKKVIDPIAPRYTTTLSNPIPVNLKGVVGESCISVPLHPKNPDVGTKTVWITPRLLIDQVDAQALKEGENATFINYGNILINKINKSTNGRVTSVDGTPNLDNKDYKKTLKLTWLADSEKTPNMEIYCVFFDHLVSKPVLGKDEDFKQYTKHITSWEVSMLGEPAMASLKKGDIVQVQRRGFFRVDGAVGRASQYSARARPLVLFHIPDGRAKELDALPKAIANTPAVKSQPAPAASNAADLNNQITKQGDLVRSLKSAKAEKSQIDEAVKALLELKAKYKEATGQDWKPPSTPDLSEVASAINKEIVKQGDLVRSLKSAKAEKPLIDEAVKVLLHLKGQYKAATGQDWKPGAAPAPAANNVTAAPPTATKKIDPSVLNLNILKQTQLIGQLRADNIDKEVVDQAIEVLKNIKAEYKVVTGKEWRIYASPSKYGLPELSGDDVLDEALIRQTDVVRLMRANRAPRSKIDPAIKALRALEARYRLLTGREWITAVQRAAVSHRERERALQAAQVDPRVVELDALIIKQGDKVRKLKGEVVEKSVIDVEVKNLLNLKEQYKALTGTVWSPKMSKIHGNDPKVNALTAEITKQGDVVRSLKANNAEKAAVDLEVQKLLELKKQYETMTGIPYAPPTSKSSKPKEQAVKPKEAKKEAKPKEKPPKPVKEDSSSGVKKITRLGLEASKETDLSEWYSQVITKSEMIDYYDISGCYILRPWSYSIWDLIRGFLSPEFKKLGVKDGYFPIFVSKAALEREKTHIADFAPEVAWVTQSGASPLAEHIAVRPTSETAMYPAYARWIQSHRDLPYKLNQWNNVVRWEFKQPQPFLRSREFLWQEGHTAFRTKEEAGEEVLQILDLYARVYEELLAVPVIKGRKTEKEKFAGADYTTTVEAYVPASGRAIQGATSHHLGQNFSKMFEIVYDDAETHEKNYVYQNSWGITTRTIGVMVLVHGDDKGLVLPPRIAEMQAVVVPCGVTASSTADERRALIDSCKALVDQLLAAGVRAEGDYRDNYSPGWKFNHWELKGVPVRVELGPKDMASGQVVAVQRFSGEKMTLKRDEAGKEILALLERIHGQMFDKATKDRDARLSEATKWEDFIAALEKKHILLAPFCGEISCEDAIKNDSARTEDDATIDTKAPAMGAKSLCIPFKQPRELTESDRCIHPSCNNKPKFITLFGRSY